MKRPNILVLAGSTRTHSVHRKIAPEVVRALQEAGADATFADLRDYPLPLYDGDLEEEQGRPATAIALKELARQADGFVIASPEYNGSYPAVLKNAIDWISRPDPGERHLAVFRGKTAGILSATPGPHGGARGLKQLRELLGMIGIEVAGQVGIAQSGAAFDADGRLAREHDIAALDGLAATVADAVREHAAEAAIA
jgi:chromate reductase, NAD(P)H dehydrogenase (quinone)